MRSSYTVPLAILIGGGIIATAIYLSLAPKKEAHTGNLAAIPPLSSSDHILGNPDAPVVIIAYTDYDCDFCRTFHETLARLVTERAAEGTVAIVYRQFPLTELHANAFKHAQAAECVAKAGGSEAFWRFSHLLFTNQPVNPQRYGSLALEAGTPTAAFQDCYARAETEVDERISVNRQNALEAGARGTPFSIVFARGRTPYVLDGAYSYDALSLIVTEALSR